MLKIVSKILGITAMTVSVMLFAVLFIIIGAFQLLLLLFL